MVRHINEIIIHATATKPNWMSGHGTLAKVQEIARWHTSPPPDGRGWRAIGYHRVIDRNGQIANGRPIAQVGAHVKGHNANSIGIALIGGHGGSADDKFQDHFTPAQDKALREEIERIKKVYPTITMISPHHLYARKGCPCFNVQEWLDEDRKAVKAMDRALGDVPLIEMLANFLKGIFKR